MLDLTTLRCTVFNILLQKGTHVFSAPPAQVLKFLQNTPSWEAVETTTFFLSHRLRRRCRHCAEFFLQPTKRSSKFKDAPRFDFQPVEVTFPRPKTCAPDANTAQQQPPDETLEIEFPDQRQRMGATV